jgi:DNA-binding LytR/AlgR family response regulator
VTTAIIADDEPLLRQELKDHLSELWPELEVIAEVGDGVSAIQSIETLRPDIAFLDIRMPQMTGIEVSEQIQGICHVVFVTAFDEHAIAAFEQGAVDYVLKPVQPKRLFSAVRRLKDRAQAERSSNAAIVAPKTLSWIQASVAQQLHFIAIDEVLYFQSDSKYTKVVTLQREAFIRTPLSQLLASLDVRHFKQISRSVVVSVPYIDRVERGTEGEMFVRLRDVSESLAVSKSHQAQFRAM